MTPLARYQTLLAIADMVEGLAPEALDMDLFSNKCGTIACAAGWAIHKGLMPEELVLVPADLNGFYMAVVNSATGRKGFDAIADALGLTYATRARPEIFEMFDPETYWDEEGEVQDLSKEAVAARIREVAERLKPAPEALQPEALQP